jgi:predicted TIM-barrel fold metal-dependent hydrolase
MSGDGPDGRAIDDPGIVDAHQHFQDLGRHLYPWLRDPEAPHGLEGDLGPIRRDYLPEDYRRDVAGSGVVKTVHVQNGWDPADPLGETRWLQGLIAEGRGPDAVVAFADLADPGVAALLDAHCACPAVRGIRQILNWHERPDLRVAPGPDLMATPAWRRGFALLERHRLAFDLQVYWPQMDMALDLARTFPGTTLVLDHFGMPIDRSLEGVAAWRAALARLAAAPNVVVKLSGLGLGHPHWRLADTLPLLDRALDTFGPDRTMVGTNLPVDRLFAEPAAILGAIRALAARLSPQDRHAVLRGTAERVYRI